MGRATLCSFLLFCSAGVGRGADLQEIVKRATAAINSDWAADPNWSCVERVETQKGDRMSSKTFQDLMIEGSDYRLPLAIDDQPLRPEREKEELLKLNEEVRRRKEESLPARARRIAEWKKRRDEDGELLLNFSSAFTFEMKGEETRNGHAAYVLSAMPKPGVVPTTRAGKVFAGMKGTAWVEKDEFHPIHVECTVIRPVPVFGPLASVLPGTDIDIGMTNVADSIWLIDEVTMKLNLSKLHMFKSSESTRTTYTHYRPNDVVLNELLARAGR